jgi:hypothetical protein
VRIGRGGEKRDLRKQLLGFFFDVFFGDQFFGWQKSHFDLDSLGLSFFFGRPKEGGIASLSIRALDNRDVASDV